AHPHTPRSVASAARTARETAAGHPPVVVFPPHLYSRTRDFAREFAAGLAPADEVLLLDVYGAREEPIEGVTSHLVAEPLSAAGTTVAVVSVDEAFTRIDAGVAAGDLVLTVGAG